MERSFAFSSRLFLAFAVIAIAFIASNACVHNESLGIDAPTRELASNALPSMEHLCAASSAVHAIETELHDYTGLPEERAAVRETIDAHWREIDQHLLAYRMLPAYPGELELYEAGIPAGLRALHAAVVQRYEAIELGSPEPARKAASREVRRSVANAAHLLEELVKLNGVQARNHAQLIDMVRRRTSSIALVLDAVALVIGAGAVLWVLRVFRARARLEEAHRALVEQRAAELEAFGTRVAHDLLSPLSALTYCLGSFKSAAAQDPPLQEAFARARGCISRAQRMVDSIFEFSRAGGKPAEGALAEVRETAEQVAAEIRAAELRDRPEVGIEPFPPLTVACAPGVLSSLLANLLGNAAKYMSDSSVRRITVRAAEAGDMVHIEVEDTGPGVPAGLEEAIFEPYFRAAGATQAGLGLGLATVRRLCAAHGGEAGVRSTPGRGSSFWITLPRALPVAESVPPVSGTLRRAG